MTTLIYHNPRCSKSRQTLELLRERGIEPTVIEYLKSPPTADEIRKILEKLGIEATALIRKNEAPYKALGLDHPDTTNDSVIEALALNPVLIERPIVIHGNRAAIGRPPESVLSIL